MTECGVVTQFGERCLLPAGKCFVPWHAEVRAKAREAAIDRGTYIHQIIARDVSPAAGCTEACASSTSDVSTCRCACGGVRHGVGQRQSEKDRQAERLLRTQSKTWTPSPAAGKARRGRRRGRNPSQGNTRYKPVKGILF